MKSTSGLSDFCERMWGNIRLKMSSCVAFTLDKRNELCDAYKEFIFRKLVKFFWSAFSKCLDYVVFKNILWCWLLSCDDDCTCSEMTSPIPATYTYNLSSYLYTLPNICVTR